MPRIVWTRQSRQDVEAIRAYIARDAPRTADAFVDRLIRSVDRLVQFPYSGSVVPETNREEIREIVHGNYRIIYRTRPDLVEIVTVYHAARLLDEELLENDE